MPTSTSQPFAHGASFAPPAQHRSAVAGVLAMHVVLAWGLLQVDAVRKFVVDTAPLMVQIVAPEAPPAPAPAPPPVVPPVVMPTLPKPMVMPVPAIEPAPVIVAESPTPAPTAPAPAPTPPAPAPVVATAPSPPAPSPTPSPQPGPRMIPPNAIQYIVPPQLDYPRASRRQRESGRAVVKVFINEAGLPQTMQIEKSTGYPLLDEAALAAVRKTRFKPYTENGRPLAGWALIPLSFDLEN